MYTPVTENLYFGSGLVRDLIHLLETGGQLNEEQFYKWKDFIMHAVKSMRDEYENPESTHSLNLRKYYASCWEQFDKAQTDKEIIAALKDLESAISWV